MNPLEFPWPVLAAPFVGSFLATLAVRLPDGQPVVGGRSACPACGARLRWFELVPLLSWLAQRGRCRACGKPIAGLYPVVEAASLLVAAWAWALRPGAWLDAGLGWTLVALAACDARARVLPDVLVIPLGLAGLAVAMGHGAIVDHAIGAAAGLLALGAVRIAYKGLRGREGLGFGDVKLLSAAGAWVAWQGLPSVVAIAAVSGLLAAGIQRLAGHPIGQRTELPFGPHLALGTWLVWLYGPLGPMI